MRKFRPTVRRSGGRIAIEINSWIQVERMLGCADDVRRGKFDASKSVLRAALDGGADVLPDSWFKSKIPIKVLMMLVGPRDLLFLVI